MNTLRCTHCGGAIAVHPGRPEPRCLFCGSDALVPGEDVREPPAGWLPFVVDQARAQAAWRRAARANWFRPGDLGDAHLELRQLLVPVWAWSGTVELYWAGLETAMFEASGKRPRCGDALLQETQVLVPASAALSQAELTGLGAFIADAPEPWHAGATDIPHEVGELSRSESRRRALDVIAWREQAALAESGMRSSHASVVPTDLNAELLLVPIWIGVAFYQDVPRRMLIHGQTATMMADLPWSWPRIAAAVAAALFAVATIVVIVGAFS